MKKISYFISNKNILLVFILLIGLALRLYQLGKLDFWIDEVWSICFTRGLDLIGDMHPPLYYAMLKFWIKIFGETEFKIRLLSALFSFFTIFIIFKLGKLMFNYKVGLISAFILSLSPIHIWYSQEARSYAFIVFLVALCAYIFFKIILEDKKGLWGLFTILLLLNLMTEYVSLLCLIPLSILLFFPKFRQNFKDYFICWAIALAGFSIWLPIFWIQFKALIERFWIPRPSAFSVINTFQDFSLGYESLYKISGAIFFFFLAFNGASFTFKRKGERWKVLVLIMMIMVPIISLLIISNKIKPVYLSRQLLPILIPYYLLIANGIYNIKLKTTKIFVTLLILSMIGHSLYNQYHVVAKNNKKPFKPIAEYIKKNFKKNDIVGITTGPAVLTLPYYLQMNLTHGELHINPYFFWENNGRLYKCLDTFPRTSSEMNYFEKLGVHNIANIWLITGSWERNGKLDFNSNAVKKLLEQNDCKEIRKKEFDGLFVELYSFQK